VICGTEDGLGTAKPTPEVLIKFGIKLFAPLSIPKIRGVTGRGVDTEAVRP